MKKIKDNKILLWVLLSVFMILSVIYYFDIYLTTNQIVFSSTDGLIVVAIGFTILLASMVLIYLVAKINSLEKNISDIKDLICDVEDNDIEMQRTTQLIFMNLSGKLGVGFDEEKL